MIDARIRRLLTGLFLAALAASPAGAESAGEPGGEPGKPNPLKNVYFGEQHMHTENSFDAFTAGNRQTWDETFRYNIQERAWTSPIWYTPDPSLVKKLDFYPGLQEELPPSGFHIGTIEKKN